MFTINLFHTCTPHLNGKGKIVDAKNVDVDEATAVQIASSKSISTFVAVGNPDLIAEAKKGMLHVANVLKFEGTLEETASKDNKGVDQIRLSINRRNRVQKNYSTFALPKA
jgi:hypothetical protein